LEIGTGSATPPDRQLRSDTCLIGTAVIVSVLTRTLSALPSLELGIGDFLAGSRPGSLPGIGNLATRRRRVGQVAQFIRLALLSRRELYVLTNLIGKGEPTHSHGRLRAG
jgi:hypothetical protein